MKEHNFVTASAITGYVTRTALDLGDSPLESALEEVYDQIDSHLGAIFSSGFDYPGRHSRWDLGFINPALEIRSKDRTFEITALNEQGQGLLAILEQPLADNPHVGYLAVGPDCLQGMVHQPPDFFTEEERSKVPSIFSVIRTIRETFAPSDTANIHGTGLEHFGLYGAFGYDLIQQFENIKLKHDRSSVGADCCLYLPLELIVVDRKKEIASKLCFSIDTPLGETKNLKGGGSAVSKSVGINDYKLSGNGQIPSTEIVCDHEPGEFASKVQKVIEGTKRGDYFEVVLSQMFSTPFHGTPTALFKRLGKLNPSPYMFLLNLGTEQLVGTSPEIYCRVSARRFETCPIAGTIRRGATALEDADRVRELMSSLKDESELTMCTDVDRNDMARVCEPGSVRIIGRRQLEFYSHLIHTVDHLEGTLKDGFDSLDAFQTHMWACTVTGAPKPAAVQEIENLETSPRGWYSAAVGLLLFNGDLNTGITLRTAVIKDGQATIRAGATLLYDSNPEMEELETRTKSSAFLAALTGLRDDESSELLPTSSPSLVPKAPAILLSPPQVVLVDCWDSFVHNLGAYLREIGCKVSTVRAGTPLEIITNLNPQLVLLSPGPGLPRDFGVGQLLGQLVDNDIPAFGVCLGHQGIGEFFGGELGQLPTPVHGKPGKIVHFGSPLFQNIESPFEAGRYHSIYIKRASLPSCLEVTAETINTNEVGTNNEAVIMGVRHRTLPVAGVQFHPESLMTLKGQAGHTLLKNVIRELTR